MTTTASDPRWTLDAHWASSADGEGHAVFTAEGIRCANCARSIQRGLESLDGLRQLDVSVVNSRVSVSWDATRLTLGRILGRVAELGFKPVPLMGQAAATQRRAEQRLALKRIGLAGLGSMQTMMYAGGLYAGAFTGIDPTMAELLKITCMVIAAPVLFYSGAPILRGALDDLKRRTLGMDITVSLALVLAFAASVFNTLRGEGEVYYDSVTMFVFLLLLGRFVEMKARHRAASTTDALARALPSSVQRIDPTTGGTVAVPLAEVAIGDLLQIGPQKIVPLDGELDSPQARLDESLVTGEATPVRRTQGAPLLGGSVNVGPALRLRVTRAVHDSTLHSLVRLLEHAQSQRPRLGLAAERMASWFIVRILLITAAVGLAWWMVDPSRAFPAVLSVLVVTCPCALSLATPVAIAAATSRLSRLGLLVTRADAIEGLAQVHDVLLDKTGTLTAGAPRLERSATPAGEAADRRLLSIAAALERDSRHPVAEALREFDDAALAVGDVREVAGRGVEGRIGGELWRVGRVDFVRELARDGTHATDGSVAPATAADATAALGRAHGIEALLFVADNLRPEAADAAAMLRRLGLTLHLASGDRPEPVGRVATRLGIHDARAQLTPDEKLAVLQGLQRDGRKVLMIGDGVNDGPVLAAADVSLAMGNGSQVAHAAADLLLLRENLAVLPEAIALSRRALVIVRQNLRWAVAYNIGAIPLAALGLVPPWIAALGMSLSSLLVVANAMRLARVPRASLLTPASAAHRESYA